MPTFEPAKSPIDDLKPGAIDRVCWDQALRGVRPKVALAGGKAFIVTSRTTDSRRFLRKQTVSAPMAC